MKFLLLAFGSLSFFVACHHSGQNLPAHASQDSVELVALLRKVYQWHQKNQRSLIDFPVTVKDSFQIGLDREAFDQTLSVLRQTDYFTQNFLENYKQIGRFVDHKLTTANPKLYNEINFPFQDSDPWTGAQDDLPSWDHFRFYDYRAAPDSASFKWRIADSNWTSEPYAVGFAKENGQWKISFLQGFDRKDYLQ